MATVLLNREARERELLSFIAHQRGRLAEEYRAALGVDRALPLKPGIAAAEMIMTILNREFPEPQNYGAEYVAGANSQILRAAR